MRFLNVVFSSLILSETWMLVSQIEYGFSNACLSDSACNQLQKKFGYKCSVCADDTSGKARCLNTFVNDYEWFTNECGIAPKCQYACYWGGSCMNEDKSYVQACFCTKDRFSKSCRVKAMDGELGLRMLQWGRDNAFTKPGEIKRFYYRSVADINTMNTGLYRMFVTGLGYVSNLGDKDIKGMSPMSPCIKKGIVCTEDYVDLHFPYLLPGNSFGITVLKNKDKLKGYLTTIDARFKCKNVRRYISYEYEVFVYYESVSLLKCIPIIQLTNCGDSFSNSDKFTFRRNEFVTINYNVKYLEDGAFLSTAKENRRLCSAKDTTWTWTWSTYYINFLGMEQPGDEENKIGTTLTFPPFKLNFGTYRVNLKIKRVSNAATNENFAQCFFTVKPLPLEVSVDGGDHREVIKNNGLTLSATLSYDPNQPPNEQDSLKILWTCECLTKNITGCENTCKINKQEPFDWLNVFQHMYIHPNELQYNAEYKFRVTLDSTISYGKGFAPQYDYVTVKVADESVIEVKNYFIECFQNCFDGNTLVNEVLFLKARIYGKGGLSEKVDEGIEFDWLYGKENDSVLHSVDSIKIGGLPSSMLGVKENSFEEGIAYIITLTERNESHHVAKYKFIMESASYKGFCTIEPQSGIQGLTLFKIKCDSFDGFIYEFYDKDQEDIAENIAYNGRMLGTSEYLGELEGVRLTRGNVVVYITHKDDGIKVIKTLKVKLSPVNISEEMMKEIKFNLSCTVNQGNLPTTLMSISTIADVLPQWVDRSEMIGLLLGYLNQVNFNTLSDVKLTLLAMKNLLGVLNKPEPHRLDLELMVNTLNTITRQAKIIARNVKIRDTSQWIPSPDVRQVSTAVLECINSATQSQCISTKGLVEGSMLFDDLFLLRASALQTEGTLEQVKDILSFIQAPGLPPAKLSTTDGSLHVWAMANDDEYPVTNMLKNNDSVPIEISKTLLRTYEKGEAFESNLIFQAAEIKRNIFSWSRSDVRSKLVSVNVAYLDASYELKKINQLSSPIFIKIGMEKNLTNTTVKGSAIQLDPHLDPTSLDLGITVHRIDIPPKSFITLRFLYPPTNESLRVKLMVDFRPDYETMTTSKDTVIINSSNPEYPIKHWSIDQQIFLYMGVLPGISVPVNKTVAYEFDVAMRVCQLWVESQWSSIGCSVSALTSFEETVCSCTHLSIFAAAFPVPPQSIDPFSDAELFLTVLENPVVVAFVIVLLIIYIILLVWGRLKDKGDEYKGKVIVLEDNFPEDTFPYLIAVHTSARFNAGTTAHVGILLIGQESKSRAHILTCSKRKVLKRNSDDWFLIYTSKLLGDIYEIQLWHDNAGSSPEWYCEKIVVYDLSSNTESIFVVNQWLALREGEYPEAILLIASDQEMHNLKRVFLDNSVLGFRDSHTILSIFVRHPRSEVTRVQRVSILMCFTTVAMLCSIMFYKPYDPANPTDDYQYNIGTREIIISVETMLITGALTMVVLLSFKRSYKVDLRKRHTTLHFRRDDYEQSMSLQRDSEYFKFLQPHHDKTFYSNYVRYVSKYLTNPPLTPVSMWDSQKMIQRRMSWYIIAWTLCTLVILGSSYLVMLYGLKLGRVQSEKWFTSLIMSMGEDMFVMGPARIIFIAILLALAFQVSTKVDLHIIDPKDVIQARPPFDYDYMGKLLETRSLPMYSPLPFSARQDLLMKKAVRRNWWLLIDFINAVLCVIVVSAIINRLWTTHYHGVDHLEALFSKTHEQKFGAVDLKKINNISMVHAYFDVVLFETLFKTVWYNQQQMAYKVEVEGIQKYWAEDGLHKMVGMPRIKQNRVVPHECRNVYFTKMKNCLLKWSFFNKDTNIYGEKWTPATYLDTIKKDSPWKYRDCSTSLWWTNQRFYGTSGTLYDVSGYFTFIGPTMKSAQKTLEELTESDWQDWFTRACFLEVTLYNVNQQVFSQVTLLFEYFIDGSMYTSITVIPVSRTVRVGVWELFFLGYAVYFLFRCCYLINLMGLLDYLKNMNNILRMIKVIFMFSAIAFWCAHHLTSIKYAEEYMKSEQNEHFDFDKFISTFKLLRFVLSLLLCFAIARSFILFHGGRRFINVYYTFIISLTWLKWLGLCFLMFVFVLNSQLYFLNCQLHFKMKEIILPQKMTENLRISSFESVNIQAFVVVRVIGMYAVHILIVLSFCYYLRVARSYKLRDWDSFNLVLFLIERIKKCCNRNKNVI